MNKGVQSSKPKISNLRNNQRGSSGQEDRGGVILTGGNGLGLW